MKQLAIYHAPQECGEPYVMLIDLETGQPIRTIDIPEGYCYSGFEVEYYYEPTGEVIRKKHLATYLPEVGEVEHYRGDKYIYLKEIIDVESWKLDLGEGDFMEGYNATLVYEISRKKQCYRFDSSKDTFRQAMEKQGIDMTGWCIYKRRKTTILDFLKAVLPKDVVNIINIG